MKSHINNWQIDVHQPVLQPHQNNTPCGSTLLINRDQQATRYFTPWRNLVCRHWYHVARARSANSARCTIFTNRQLVCALIIQPKPSLTEEIQTKKIDITFCVVHSCGGTDFFFSIGFSLARCKHGMHAITFQCLLGFLQVLSAGPPTLKELRGLGPGHRIPRDSHERYSWPNVCVVLVEIAVTRNSFQQAISHTGSFPVDKHQNRL